MDKKIKKDNKEALAIGQIIILVVAIVGFAWIIGGGVKIVSAKDKTCSFKGHSGSCVKGEELSSCSNFYLGGGCKDPTPYCCTTNTDTNSKSGKTKSDFKTLPDISIPVPTDILLKNIKSPSTILGSRLAYSIAYPLAAIAATAAGAYAFSRLFQLAGGSTFQQNLLGGVGAGIGAAATLYFGFPSAFAWLGGVLHLGALATGGAVALFVFFLYEAFVPHTKEQGVVYYNCRQWIPQTKGEHCNLCNNQEVPCSIYQCKSLGQNCEFVQSDSNHGGRSFCFWNSRNDITPPIITPDKKVLTVGYDYQNLNGLSNSNRGVKIIDTKSKDGCLSPFSKFTFGVKLNEPGKCKLSFSEEPSYKKMSFYMGGSSKTDYYHSNTIKIPKINNSLGKDNQILAYVRCQDSNGNADKPNFIFKMCVQKGPDTTAPVIDGTSIKSGARVSFNVTSAKVDFYINEPSNCKWDFSDKKYEKMENNMTCATNATRVNIRLDYTCSAILTGIKSTAKTTYYIKCQDVSPLKNTDKDYYLKSKGGYTLQSSKALVILSASPNGTTIKGSTTPATVILRAKTIGGVKEGDSTCSYSSTGVDGDYKFFREPDSQKYKNIHSTKIYLQKGNYTYYIRCVDDGGNSDTKKISFSVDIDQEAPLVERVYYDEGSMKIITNEKADCFYSTSDCDYPIDDGVKISSDDGINHLMTWDTENTLYVKCKDVPYGNQPTGGQCSIIVRAQNGKNF